ncbi:MAG: endonuclease/exonuclease/phosphatase family protein [Paracoccaceae bacterium]
MPFYHDLKFYDGDPVYPNKQSHIADRLLALRADLHRDIAADRVPNSLIVGSWNIRAFDDGVARLDESYHYIAEIISNFDICAVQEVKGSLNPLERLRKLLGPAWDYFVSDVSVHTGGNNERMAFLYNKNKVFFRRLVGELVVDPEDLPQSNQIARSPFFAAFQAGWFRFVLCSSHIIYGGGSAKQKAQRADEIRAITKLLVKRARSEDEVYIFLGDMNIESPSGPIMQALKDSRMVVPDFPPTNMKRDRHYDQMAFATKGASGHKTKILRWGAFDWRGAVFGPKTTDRSAAAQKQRTANLAHYEAICTHQRTQATKPKEPYEDFARSYPLWTTFEMSDHLPIWVELEVDYSNEYLSRYL